MISEMAAGKCSPGVNVKQSVQCESQYDGGVTSSGERMEVHGLDS